MSFSVTGNSEALNGATSIGTSSPCAAKMRSHYAIRSGPVFYGIMRQGGVSSLPFTPAFRPLPFPRLHGSADPSPFVRPAGPATVAAGTPEETFGIPLRDAGRPRTVQEGGPPPFSFSRI